MPSATDYNSCLSDPNFAVICSFLQHYADILNIKNPTFKELQDMIENKNDVSPVLVDTIISLLRKSKIKVDRDRWERRLSKFCATYSTDDAEAVVRFGFKNIKTSVKLRILKELLEYQFDQNTNFKKAVNELTPDKQRKKPLLQDDGGRLFWTMTDSNDDAIVYEEDLQEKSWNVLAHDRDELINIVRRTVPAPKPVRTSARISLGNATKAERTFKAKDLLNDFRVSIGRSNEIDSER